LCHAPGPINGDLFAFGTDDDDLLSRVRFASDFQATQPGGPWTFTFPNAPQTIYFELNHENFTNIVNSVALQVWANTQLPGPFQQSPGLFVPQTKVEAEGSRRATFPTTAGTDGQRLRQGKTK